MSIENKRALVTLVDRLQNAAREHAMKTVLHASRPQFVTREHLEEARKAFDTARMAFNMFVGNEQ